jgi:hypothetical protein
MAGLTNPALALPVGYNSRTNFPAVEKMNPLPPPSAYNRDTLSQAPGLRKTVPVPIAGMPWPNVKRIDEWHNTNARTFLPPIHARYNTDKLPHGPDAKTAPTTHPWSKEDALSKLQSSSGEGNIRPPRGDMISVAKVFMETTTDPAQKEIWERLVNSLAQLDAIAQSRPLTPEESKKKDEIIRQIAEKSQGPLAIDEPPAAPKPVPATAADIAALIAGMSRSSVPATVKRPGPPPVTPMKTPPGPPPVTPMKTPPGPPSVTPVKLHFPPGPPLVTPVKSPPGPPSITPVKSPPGPPPITPTMTTYRAIVDPPADMGPPTSGIYKYTQLPDEWKSPGAAKDTAFYITNPSLDANKMMVNMLNKYPHGNMPKDEFEIWKKIIISLNPDKSGNDLAKAPRETHAAYIQRNIIRSSAIVMKAYLANPKYFDYYAGDKSRMVTELPKLVEASIKTEFPLHPGMESQPMTKIR